MMYITMMIMITTITTTIPPITPPAIAPALLPPPPPPSLLLLLISNTVTGNKEYHVAIYVYTLHISKIIYRRVRIYGSYYVHVCILCEYASVVLKEESTYEGSR